MADQNIKDLIDQMTPEEIQEFISGQTSQQSSQAPQAISDVQPSRYLDILGSAAKESVNALPPVAQFTQPGRYSEVFSSGVGPEMDRQMNIPEGQPGLVSDAMKVQFNPFSPMAGVSNISSNLMESPKNYIRPDQATNKLNMLSPMAGVANMASKNYLKHSMNEGIGLGTAPFSYMIGPLIDILPVGKATVGELTKLPPSRIKDAITGKLSPEAVDRFMQRIAWVKKYGDHAPASIRNENLAPNPEQASVPNVVKNETYDGVRIQDPNPTTPEAPKPYVPQVEPPPQSRSYNQGTGEEKVRGLAQSVENRVGQNLGELPSYNVLQDKAQRQIFNNAIAQDPSRVMRIAMGQESAPNGSTSSAFLKYLEEKALKEGDLETLRKLATESEVLKQATEAGQFVSSLRDMNPESPVKAVDDIISARKESLKRQKITPENETKIKEIQSKLDEAEKKLKDYISKESEKAKPSSKEFGSKNRIFTKDVYNIASSNLKQKLSGFHSGIDPTAIKEVTQIGGYYFEGGLIEFQEWSAKMVAEFGENIKPYLEESWKNINLVFKNAERNKIIGNISKALKEGNNLSEVGFQINKLARSFVEGGIKDREALIDAVHKVLKEEIPGITRRETMDAISGYGKYKMLSKGEIESQLRDLKGQMQQIGKLEDLQAKKAPLKTGIERRIPSDEERRLLTQVNEAKKRFNLDNPDPEKHLKSALETAKTRLLNQIKDLKTQIESRENFVKEKYSAPDSPEIAGLRAQRDKLKEQFYDIFGKPGMSDESRLQKALESTRKSILELKRRISEKDLSPSKTSKPLPQITPELEKAWKLRDQLKEQYAQLKEASRVKKSPQEIKLGSLKTRMAHRIAELQEKLDNRNFATKQKANISLDPEAIKLQAKKDQMQMAYDAAIKSKGTISDAEVSKIVQLSKEVADKKALIDHSSPKGSPSRMDYGFSIVDFKRFVADLKLKAKALTWEDFKQRPFRTAGRKSLDVLGADKYLVATGDFSATLLQGGKMIPNHPEIWAENTAKQFSDFAKTLKGVDAERLTMADIYSRPNFLNGEYKRLGLDFDELEEAFPVPAVEKIPKIGRIFKGYENAFTGFIRKSRADLFDNWYAKLDAKGADKKGLGVLANSFMGRGVLPFGMEKISGTLNKVLFAPKNLMADIDFILASQNKMDTLSPEVKAIAMKNLLVSTTATAITLATAYAINSKSVEFNTNSSDFGNIRRGNTSYGVPFMGKSLKIVTLLSRLATHKYKSSVTGKTTKLNTGEYGSKTAGDVIAEFFQNRLSPVASVVNDREFRGTDFKGEKPTLAGDAKKILEPFPIQTFQELMKDPDVVNQMLGNIYALFGGSVTSYPRKGRR